MQTKLGGAGAVTIAGAFNVTGSSTLTGSGIGDDQQVWDIIGQLVSVHSTDGTSTYTYDADSQLVGADYSFQPNETFGYDPNGNPTSASVGDANRILSDGTFDYTYDAEGNRIRRVEIATGTSVEYQWDHRNRLVGTITRDGAGNVVQTEQIRYDDFGWKIERTLDADGAGPQAANTERFVHDRDQIVMVFADPATPSEIFTYGPRVDMVLSEQHGADLAWSLADHLGSVRDVVSSDGGTVLDHLTYNAFGLITGQTDAGAAPRFSFAGRELDTALNLYDERARYYDPSLQRFISEDPTGFMQSFLLPVGARELTFTLNVHFDPAGNGPQVEVALLDATTKASLLGGIGLTQTDAAANLEADGSVYQTAGVQISGLSNGRLPSVSGPLTATISLAGVAAGQAVSLYFDLLGFGASGSVVTIDDVRILTGAENTAPTANDDAFTLVEDTPKVIDVLTNDTDAEHDTLSAVIITAPAHGTLSTNADGTLTYIPAANYNGTDSFTYKANDGELDSAVATVSLSIAPVNDPPVAVNDVFATNEDTALVVSAPQGVLANDSDVDSATLTALLVGGPSHGTVLLNADGSFTYTPAANFNGMDSFTYKANDGDLDSAVATVSLSIAPVNDPPVARNDSFTTNEDTALVVSAPQGVLANDSDVDSATLTALLVGGPSHGTVVLNADGSFTYTPAANFNGTDSFTYKANDGELDSAVATVSLSIAPVNDPPVAFNISGSVPEHGPATAVSASYTDPDVGDTHSFSIDTSTDGTKGKVTNNGDGTFTYDPNGMFASLAAGTTATDRFLYTVTDAAGASSTAMVTITITGQNDAPAASNVSGAVLEHGPATTVSASYTDPDVGDTHTFTINTLTDATKGKATNSGNGTFTYDPNGMFAYLAAGTTATDRFLYTATDAAGAASTATVTITITGQNDAPVAANVSGAVLANGPATTVMASYTDPDVGDTHTFTINTLADATKGKVTNSGGGTFTYDPNGAFASLLVGQTATDRFLYTVTDGSGAASTATVTISVTGQKVINHPPVIAAADKVETALITESRYDPIVQTVYGAIRFTDADPADRPTASIVSETILDLDEHGRPHPLNDPVLSALKAGFTIAPERGNTNNGAIDWTYSIADKVIDPFLAAGETLTLISLIKVDDHHGGTDTATVIITFLGKEGSRGGDGDECGDDHGSGKEGSRGVADAVLTSLGTQATPASQVSLSSSQLTPTLNTLGAQLTSGLVPSSHDSQTSPITSVIPLASTTSLNVTFASSSGDKSVGFKLAYDSELLSVVGAEPGSESAIAPLATVATQTGTSITNVNMPATSSTASSDQVSQSPSITAVAPLSAATKLNATFTSGGGVKSVVFKLVYDPELVTVTGAELGAGMPNGAQIAFTTAATERAAEAEAYIAVTSDQPIAAGTINLASVSIDPRRSVETLDGLLKLVVEDVNSKLFSEPEAVRISIDGLKLGSSETSDTARDTLPQIDFFASSKVNEDPSPKIRLKIPDQDASPDQGSGESASADDLMADPENVDMPFRIAIADVRTNEMDDSLSSRFEHSRRWTLDWRDNDAATDSLRKVRIPIASLAKGSGASGNPAISLR